MNTFWYETREGTVLRILEIVSLKHSGIPLAGTGQQV